MKKTLISLVVPAALLAFSSSAMAEVVIYGEAAAGVEHVKSGDFKEARVSNQGSHIGFKGSEELGNGLEAIWQIERTVAIDGSSVDDGEMRDTFVGLKTNGGTVKLGKNTSPYKQTMSGLDLFEDETASVQNGFGRLNSRLSNSVKYDTPSWGGFTASAAWATDESKQMGVNNSRNGQTYSVGANYEWNNALNVGAAYEQRKDFLTDKDKMEGIKAGASYTFNNNAFVGAGYERLSYNSGIAGVDKSTQNAATLSGSFPVTSAIDIKGNYTKMFDVSNVDNSGANIYSVGADYKLSKRTKMGAYYTMVDNDENSSVDLGNNLVLDQNKGNQVVDGEKAQAFGVNLKHKF